MGRSWSRGWKGELCAGTYLGSAAGHAARHGGWLAAFGVESGQALGELSRAVMGAGKASGLGWTLPEYGPVW